MKVTNAERSLFETSSPQFPQHLGNMNFDLVPIAVSLFHTLVMNTEQEKCTTVSKTVLTNPEARFPVKETNFHNYDII